MADDPADPIREHLLQLGQIIREQRKREALSLRELARLTGVSDPYLSQIERGLHEPSVRILKSIAAALDLRAEALLHVAAGLADEDPPESATEQAILTDPLLDEDGRETVLRVYRSFARRPAPD